MTNLDLAAKGARDEAHTFHFSWRTIVCVFAVIASVLALPWVPYSPLIGFAALAATMVAYHRDLMWRLALVACVILFFAHCALAWTFLL